MGNLNAKIKFFWLFKLAPQSRITLIYIFIGSLWIFISDYLLSFLFQSVHSISVAQTYKGLAYVLFTAVFLYLLIKNDIDALQKSYDVALEGWVQALDMRDNEIEGHTQRVTRITLELAHRMGVAGDALTAIRRGALLHDIGKLGVPDEILHKSGPLTESEWEIMREHPVDAYRFISAAEHLRSAADIPYCHHEKWDGSGYPRGLVGKEIPLAARIFAVVDVWDALTSRRPYRPAWDRETALAHIKASAGSHFDPDVVDGFVKMVEECGIELAFVGGKDR